MAFPSSPSPGDRHEEDGVTYIYQSHTTPSKCEWVRREWCTERALRQALLDIADLKSRVTSLES